MTADKSIDQLTEAEARDELARLAVLLGAANTAYHGLDAPDLTDADYRVEKMKFRKLKDPGTGKAVNDRGTVIYNSKISITGKIKVANYPTKNSTI